MNKKKRWIVSSFLIILLIAFGFLYFQTPTLQSDGISQITIATLPSPPKQKKITGKEDIQKFVAVFNGHHLSPRLGISVPAGTSMWIEISGPTETHEIAINGEMIQFDKRYYSVDGNLKGEIGELYDTYSYPETVRMANRNDG